MRYDKLFDSDENRILMAICTRRLIRNIGKGGIIWGIINILIGVGSVPDNIVNVGILILGVMMLSTGIHALKRPTLDVLLAETVVTILLFLWNTGLAVINMLAGHEFDFFAPVFTLAIAVVFGNNYRKLGHLRDVIPSVPCEKIEATKKVCKTILKKKLKDEPLIVSTRDRKCRAQLMADRAFFIQKDLMRAFTGTRADIQAAVAKPDEKSWTAIFNHPLGTLKYRFDKQNSAKLKAWLSLSPGLSEGNKTTENTKNTEAIGDN